MKDRFDLSPNIFNAFLTTLRPRQWTKNLILFAGLIFSQNLQHTQLGLRAAAGFAIFCLLSGVVYLFNDIADIDLDRRHPVKKTRPIAAGVIPIPVAARLGAAALIVALACAWLMGRPFFLVSAAFLVLNLGYTKLLKRFIILDVFGISLGFILRAVASVEVLRPAAPGIGLSKWLVLCTLFLSLFLGFCKRRSELVMVFSNGSDTRPSLHHYNEPLLNLLIGTSTGLALMSYVMYTVWPTTVSHFGTANLVLTSPFVFLGIGRYLMLVFREGQGGRPHEILLGDMLIKISVVCWIVAVCAVIGFSG